MAEAAVVLLDSCAPTPVESVADSDNSDRLTVSGFELDDRVPYPQIGQVDLSPLGDGVEAMDELDIKTHTLSTPLPERPGMPIALTGMRARAGKHGLRFWCSVTNIQRGTFDTQIHSLGKTTVEFVGLSYLQILAEHDFYGFQHGEVSLPKSGRGKIPEISSHCTVVYTRIVFFPTPYDKPPKVVLWLSGFEINAGHDCTVSAKLGKIERDRFEIFFGTWSEGQLKDVKVTWVSYSATAPNIRSGMTTTEYRRERDQPQHYNRDYVSFQRKGVLVKPPRIIAGINEVDFKADLPVNLSVGVDNVTPYGFTWDADSRGDSVMYAVGISWLAMI